MPNTSVKIEHDLLKIVDDIESILKLDKSYQLSSDDFYLLQELMSYCWHALDLARIKPESFKENERYLELANFDLAFLERLRLEDNLDLNNDMVKRISEIKGQLNLISVELKIKNFNNESQVISNIANKLSDTLQTVDEIRSAYSEIVSSENAHMVKP